MCSYYIGIVAVFQQEGEAVVVHTQDQEGMEIDMMMIGMGIRTMGIMGETRRGTVEGGRTRTAVMAGTGSTMRGRAATMGETGTGMTTTVAPETATATTVTGTPPAAGTASTATEIVPTMMMTATPPGIYISPSFLILSQLNNC